MLPMIAILTVALYVSIGSALGWVLCLVLSIGIALAANFALTRVFERGFDALLGLKGRDAQPSIGRQLAGLGVALALLAYFWTNGGSPPATPRPAGATATLMVAGTAHSFPDAIAEHSKFLGDTYHFEVGSMNAAGEEVLLSFGFFCSQGRPEELKGVTLASDYREHNPESVLLEECWNYFRAGGKFYQGHNVEVTVETVSEKEVTLVVQGEYLEFARDEETLDEEGKVPARGTPVAVSGRFSLPLHVETGESGE